MKFVYILAAILVFGVLIAIHEFGHFITAKLCGVKVNEFSIGMGPAIWTREKGETLYALRALPIGGYCAMEGEDEDSDDERAFRRAAHSRRSPSAVAASKAEGAKRRISNRMPCSLEERVLYRASAVAERLSASVRAASAER